MKTFSGLYTALITPFKNNKIDEKALEKIIEFQIAAGVSGIVPCGTTGESPTLNYEEHNLMIKLSVDIAAKRVQVIAGTGANSTSESIMLTNYAKKVGADASLQVAPYYNKPTGTGLYQHFKTINDQCDIPIILYNVPGRCVVNISDETIANLAKLKNIIGIKDATGDLARVASLKLMVDENFVLLTGEDVSALGFRAMGGDGIISVTSNIAPKKVGDLQRACEKGDYKLAVKIQDELTNLHLAIFCETNPIPIKYAASLMGFCENEIRLPLCEPSETNKIRIKKEMKLLKLF